MRASAWVLPVAALLSLQSGAYGVVLHPGDDTGAPAPPADVVGRWGTTGSAVAIGDDKIIATRHQGGGVGTHVVFGGNTYKVDQEFLYPGADLRVAIVVNLDDSPATLPASVPVYTGADNVATVSIGGWGRGRGNTLSTTVSSTTFDYGYTWSTPADNNTQRWGQNRLEFIDTSVDSVNGFTTEVLVGDFDRPDAAAGENKVAFEAMPALYDSGGGWFILDGSDWKVWALTLGVEHNGEAHFRDTTDTDVDSLDPDLFSGVKLNHPEYANFIAAVPEPTMALSFALSALMLMRKRK